tara:strand:+ start:392 stop:1015 length:624 start_codon:yes stop_codon:yes gene_type:complete
VTKNRIKKLIEEKEERGEMNDISFLQSLQSWLARSGQLSEKQAAALERIEYLNSEAGRKEVQEWKQEYSNCHIRRAQVCARYYLANPPYFNDLASNIISKVDFVPTRRQFEAMCHNKYTNRVWAESQREPSYATGDIVKIREDEKIPYHLYSHRGKLAMVVENNGHVTTHAKGGKTYRLLPFGHPSMIECQERHVKSFRKKKGEEHE